MTELNRRAARLASACPGLALSTDAETLDSHGRDWTRFREPAPAAVAFPENADQVRALVRAAVAERIPLVPSGGRTGLSGGAVAADGEVVVSFDRMRRILDFDPVDRTLTVEAGVVTAAVQQAAREHGLFYPVSFAAEGSSQIGGNIATNAGGIRVLRYGMTRDWVAGLKLVDGRGELLDCNRGLVKNATGYDLRHLAIGSEGTLGFIVEATLRLTDEPPASRVMLLGLSGLPAMMEVFGAFRRALTLTAFEFFAHRALEAVCEAHALAPPLDTQCPYYAVIEFDCDSAALEERALACFEEAVEAGWVEDGAMSQSEQQAADLWRYREDISEAITPRVPYKNDLVVRTSRVPGFLDELDALIGRRYPEFEVVWFGHIGDGNLHMNVLKPEAMTVAEFEAACEAVNDEVFELARRFGGSISAEHGIGLLKRPYLAYSRAPAEIELMRAIKRQFDPAGILNPGKLLEAG